MRVANGIVLRRFGWWFLLSVAVFVSAGCPPPGPGNQPQSPPLDSQNLLAPVAIRIHHSSSVMRKAAGGDFDGLVVACEALDRFGDPVKAVGVMRFEVYSYAPSQPDNRGPRLGFWPEVRIDSLQTIQQHWDSIWGLYRFNLNWDQQLSPGQRFVLEATLLTSDGQQFSDSHILHVSP